MNFKTFQLLQGKAETGDKGGICMQIQFLGAAHEVTGSCHFVSFDDKNILVDCGMEQGPDLYVNQEIPVNAAAIDYVFVTHAHIDHCCITMVSVGRFLRQPRQHNYVISC